MARDCVELVAIGDTSPGMEPPERLFQPTKELLQSADVRFAQVERLFTERGTFQYQGLAPHVRQPQRMASAYASIPFDVVGIGSNRTGDWGPEGAEDTISAFEQLGIPTVGAGRNIADARKPAIISKEGFKIAFLGYVSVLLPQYWATENRGGATPMRARTFYEPYEYQPGAPPRVVTIPHAQDLKALEDDIRRAKQQADFVVVSFHWGVHWVPKPLCDYQITVAHAAVDAGASVIVGHHPHVIQAIEMYKGAAVFYSLGNFAFFRRKGSPSGCAPMGEVEFNDVYTKQMEPGYTYKFDRFRDEGGAAFIQMDSSGLKKVTFQPTVMNEERQATIVRPGDAKFEEIRRYLVWVSDAVEGGIRDTNVEDGRLVLFERE